MTPVSRTIPCIYTVPGNEPYRGQVTMRWEHSAPFQVSLEFVNADDTTSLWVVSRDVFADCLLNNPGPRFGGHNFTVERGLATLSAELHSPEGNATVTFPLQEIIAFMSQTLLRVPRGEAEASMIQVEMDAWLKGVLENG